MTATMARQWGQVWHQQSDMHLALDMAKMAKVGMLRITLEEPEW
jgi:hypothetical protein